jgi:hypothetical protein
MAVIPTKYVNPGDTIRSAPTNTVYTGIATGTAALDDDNTRQEWCSRQHIDGATMVNNTDFYNVNSTSTMVFATSAAYTLITLGATPMTINFAPAAVIQPGEVLRAHFDVNIDSVTYATPAAGFLSIASPQDVYGFTFFWNIGAGLVQAPWSPDSFYSISAMTQQDPGAAFAAQSVAKSELAERHRQRCNLSMIYINVTNAPVTVSALQARVRVVNSVTLTSMTLIDGILTAMVPRR